MFPGSEFLRPTLLPVCGEVRADLTESAWSPAESAGCSLDVQHNPPKKFQQKAGGSAQNSYKTMLKWKVTTKLSPHRIGIIAAHNAHGLLKVYIRPRGYQ